MKVERKIDDLINDILNQITKIKKYISGISYEELVQNNEKLDAIIYCLAVIGEAANKIPKEVQIHHKDIKWRKIISMRNILVHYYYGADDMVIWKTINNDLPDLENQILSIKNKSIK